MAANLNGGKVNHKVVTFAAYATSTVKAMDLRVEEREFDLVVKPGSGDVVVKTMYISLDPYYRVRMTTVDNHSFTSWKIGEVLDGFAVGKVILSANPEYQVGDLVYGRLKFQEYILISRGKGLRKLAADVPPSYYLGVCGMPGITAWAGLKFIGKPKPGEEVFVSAALGAVGQIVGQLAKVYGCRVVGSAGSDYKVELLKTKFGYDNAFNYKEKNLGAALEKYFPKGIDVYFDNVGGEMLDAVLVRANTYARIALCGSMSQHELDVDKKYCLKNIVLVIVKSLLLEGFSWRKYVEHSGTYMKEVTGYLKEGKVKYKEHITEGIENLPAAFEGLMKGENVGKAIVHVGN